MQNPIEFEKLINNIPDFPKKGVIFKDISPLLETNFDAVIQAMGEKIDWQNIDLILGIESRGFILGSAMAMKYGKGFLPIRKKGKLPPPVIGEDYTLEYGTDTLEMRLNEVPKRVVLVDDVLATGGTLKACESLCRKNNYEIASISVLINLKFLNSYPSSKLHSVLNYD